MHRQSEIRLTYPLCLINGEPEAVKVKPEKKGRSARVVHGVEIGMAQAASRWILW